MANIKNFGISGVASDVQFGKTGGRVVYDSGNSVFKITSDGSTLGTLRVATPTNAADAATKQYVDDRISSTGGDVASEESARIAADEALQLELDATQAAAGLNANGGLTAPTGTDYLGSITTLKGGLVALDSALASEVSRAEAAELGLSNDISDEAAVRLANDNTLQGNIDTEEAARIAADNALDARLDIVEGGVAVEGSIAKAEADAKAYTDAEIDSLDTSLRNYIDTEVSAKDNTDEITEGTTNLFFTNARARAAISVTDAGGDGSLSYNSSTGVITYTGPSAAEVRAHLSAGTGVSYSNGQFSIGQDVSTTANVTFGSVTTTGNVTVGGALSVAGNSTFTANITGNTMSLTGNLTVAGDTVLSEKVTIKSDLNGVVGAGASTTAVFEITDSDGSDKLFQVMQNGDTIIGGVLTVNGAGTSTFAGDVSINGNITVAGDATFLANVSGNAMTMTGDLEVVGNTVLSQLVTVESNATLALGSDTVNVFEVVSSDAAKLFEVRQNGDAIIGGTLTVNGSSAALTGNLTTSGDATVSGDLSVGGTLTVAGDATFQANISGTSMTLSGDLIVGDADTDRVVFNADVDSNFIPNATGTFDLGTASKEWNNVYANMVYADLTGNVSGNISGQVTDISNHASYIKGLLSATDAGGDGSFSYNSSTGVFTYTGPSATEVRAHFSGGTGVSITNGVVAIGQAVGTTDNVTFNDVTVNGSLYSNDITATEVVITGNLVVNGTTTTVNTETIALSDNTIVLNSNATGAATQDAGLEVERGTDTNVSLLWDETNDKWTVGTQDFVAANFIGDLIGDVTGTVSDISNHDTDALAEGSTNLYYLDSRVATYLVDSNYTSDMQAYADAAVADKDSFVIRATLGTSTANIGTLVNVAGKTYYATRIIVKVTSAYSAGATIVIGDGTNTLMAASENDAQIAGAYVADLDYSVSSTGGATIAATIAGGPTAGAAIVTVEYAQL